jgi:hypothetical protein
MYVDGIKIVQRQPKGIVIAHPLRAGGIYLHRFVKELEVSRELDRYKEVVFPKDGDLTNLADDNLELTDKRSHSWFKKGKLYPIPSKFMFWLLYRALHLSALTIARFYEVDRYTCVYTAMRVRGIERRPLAEKRNGIWSKWNKLIRGFIS